MSVLTRGQNLHVSSAYINNQHVHDKFFDFWSDSVTDMAITERISLMWVLIDPFEFCELLIS